MSGDDLLGGLLGPADPELTCDECFDQLDRYVELELDGRDADAIVPGMRPHLEGCPACRDDRDSLAALLARRRQPARPGCMNGVVVASSTKPSRWKMGLLSADASACR